ncbi:MAG: heme-binding protein [Micropepsaceae bacterium]
MPFIRTSTISLVCAAAVTFGPSANAQVLTRHSIPIEMAKTMANVAQETCAEMGYSVSVHVLDTAGDTLVAYRGEDSGVHTFVNSFRKAYTAMTFRRPSANFGERWADGQVGAQLQLMLPDMAGQQGGFPIRLGDEVIGGIGASGAGQGADSVCVEAGMAAVADQIQ